MKVVLAKLNRPFLLFAGLQICILFLALPGFGFSAEEPGAKVSLVGVKIRVPDLAEAKRFYIDVLRFGIAKDVRDGHRCRPLYDYLYELESNGKATTTTGQGTETFVRRGGAWVNSGWFIADKQN